MSAEFTDITIVTHPRYVEHDTGGDDHPENPSRMSAVLDQIDRGLLSPAISKVTARAAEREWILAIHEENYLFRLEEACLSGKESLGHPDNRIGYDTYEVAFLAAGAGPTGIDMLEEGKAGRVFCCIRPPGHHAEAGLALGFCFLNNTAIAARYWQGAYNRKRIFIVDWDAHHGNGIQEAFDQDPDVFYASIHEHPTFSFPGTGYAYERGSGPGEGATLNVPLPPGTRDEAVLRALDEQIGPALEGFRPDAMLVAAGFDGHRLDDMSGLAYTTRLYGRLGVCMAAWADRYCNGRLVSLLEGGYHRVGLAHGVEAYLGGLALK